MTDLLQDIADWLLRRCRTCHGAGIVSRWEKLLTDAEHERLRNSPRAIVDLGPNRPMLVHRRCAQCKGRGR